MAELKDIVGYHNVSKEKARELVVPHIGRNGFYLLRPSGDMQGAVLCTLCVTHNSKLMNYRVMADRQRKSYYINQADQFSSIPNLISHYTQHTINEQIGTKLVSPIGGPASAEDEEQAASPTTLPHPWQQFYDDKYQRQYYYNPETNVTTWERQVINLQIEQETAPQILSTAAFPEVPGLHRNLQNHHQVRLVMQPHLGQDGSYLLRPSSSDAQPVLCVSRGGKILHFRIYQSGGQYFLNQKRKFTNIQDLIAFYHNNGIRTKSQSYEKLMLVKPIPEDPNIAEKVQAEHAASLTTIPRPWQQFYSDGYQRLYYYNPETSVTTWERPVAKVQIEQEPQVLSDERAQAIIDQALQSRSMKQRNVVAAITGLTGSGKTWLLSRLFHRPPPHLYTSTGITEQSFRGLLHHIGNISAGSWKLLSHKDIREFLAPLFLAGMVEADIDSLAADLIAIDASETTTQNPVPLPSPPPPGVLSEATPQSTTPVDSKPSLPKASPTCQEMVKLVKAASGSSSPFILELVHMIDTGGQPEFMEMMPCLVHNTNLAVVVVNLKFGLDEHVPIHFHVDDIAYTRLMLSQHTSRQIIEKLVCTFQAKRLSPMKGKVFRILVVATHRDGVEGDLAARIEALNQELKSILLPSCKDELIVFSANQIAFVLNLKDPDDDDEAALELIRENISENDLGEIVDVPGSFLMYEQDLLKYAGVIDRDILSLGECLQVGDRLKMNEEVVKAALIFFHRQNTFLYFQHVLPNLVFVKPQAPLKVINAVVLFAYKISAGILHGIPAKLVSSLQDSIITENMLHHDELSACFIPGLYEPCHTIELFCHTFTIAPLSCEHQQSKIYKKKLPHSVPASNIEEEKEYLMMCLLPAIPNQDLPQLIPSASEIVPLVVKFTNDCVPLGIFCSIISCLLSKYEWKVCRKEDGSPECLAHNIVCLYHPTLPVKIILVDSTSLIEVHVDADEEFNDDLPEMCSEIRQTVFDAIENVVEIMHLTKIEVSSAILCPCQKIPQAHCASLLRLKTKQSLRCSITNSTVTVVNRKHTMWFDDDTSQTLLKCRNVTVLSGESLTLPKLMELNVPEVVGTNYKKFGTLLLNDDTGIQVDNIEDECRGRLERINTRILQEWLVGRGRSVTWNTLVTILRDCNLDFLADKIMESLHTSH